MCQKPFGDLNSSNMVNILYLSQGYQLRLIRTMRRKKTALAFALNRTRHFRNYNLNKNDIEEIEDMQNLKVTQMKNHIEDIKRHESMKNACACMRIEALPSWRAGGCQSTELLCFLSSAAGKSQRESCGWQQLSGICFKRLAKVAQRSPLFARREHSARTHSNTAWRNLNDDAKNISR
jgi:hypothetical protein